LTGTDQSNQIRKQIGNGLRLIWKLGIPVDFHLAGSRQLLSGARVVRNQENRLLRSCEKIPARRRNRLRHHCKSCVANGGAGGFACLGRMRPIFSQLSNARGSETQRRVFTHLPSRDRQGAALRAEK
jgi:hypothetical protein